MDDEREDGAAAAGAETPTTDAETPTTDAETPTTDAADDRDVAAGTAAGAGDEEERVRAVMDELQRLKVEDLALDMAVSLVTVGYQKLGLTEQTRPLRDLDGARLSIELLRASLDVLEREGAGVKLGDLRGTLAAMQLNYARVADERSAGAAHESGAAAKEPGAAADAPADAADAGEAPSA